MRWKKTKLPYFPFNKMRHKNSPGSRYPPTSPPPPPESESSLSLSLSTGHEIIPVDNCTCHRQSASPYSPAGRLKFLDTARVYAIWLVMITHAKEPIYMDPTSTVLFYTIGFEYIQCSLFFMISGALLLNKNGVGNKNEERIWYLYRNRIFQRLVLPLVGWAVIYFVYFRYAERNRKVKFSLNMFWSFWFIFKLVPLYMLLPLYRLLFSRKQLELNYLKKIVVYIVCLWFLCLLAEVKVPSPASNQNQNSISIVPASLISNPNIKGNLKTNANTTLQQKLKANITIKPVVIQQNPRQQASFHFYIKKYGGFSFNDLFWNPYCGYFLMGGMIQYYQNVIQGPDRRKWAIRGFLLYLLGAIIVGYVHYVERAENGLAKRSTYQNKFLVSFRVFQTVGCYIWLMATGGRVYTLAPRLIDSLSKASYGIYFSHMIVIKPFRWYFVNHYRWMPKAIYTPVIATGLTIVCWVLVLVMKRIPILKKIV